MLTETEGIQLLCVLTETEGSKVCVDRERERELKCVLTDKEGIFVCVEETEGIKVYVQ